MCTHSAIMKELKRQVRGRDKGHKITDYDFVDAAGKLLFT